MKKAFLFLLGLFASIGLWAQTSPYTGSEVGEGEFYLYNVGTGLWIQNIDANNRRSDDNWNTGAGMGTAGFDFVLTAVDGGYKLDPKEAPNNLGYGYGDGGILYLDGNIGGNTHWDFIAVDGVSNGYKITIGENVLAVEVVEGKAFLVNTDTENDVWQLVTKAERLEKMQDIASADEPYDLSALMGDWNFATNNQRRSQWTEVQNGGNNDGFPRAKRWNSSHLVWNTNSYSWTQTISDLPDGLYQFSVQGMYRDGNRNQVGQKAKDGTTNLIAKYFIGASEGSLMSILEEASETQGDGFATAIENTDPQLYAPDNADNWTIVWALHPDKYWNKPVKANVRGGSVELGVRKTELIGGDWIAMNEFKLEYVGAVDPEIDKEVLQNAIAAAEAFNGATSEALASQLSEALGNAKEVLESASANYQDYANQADNLLQVLNAAKAVDVSALKATATLAKAEGIDTSVADELVANATESGPVNDALFDLRAARKVKAQAVPDIYTGSEPAEGKVYIYNLGTGMFLGTGASYNTHCAVDQVGIEIELIANGDGFELKTNRGGGWLNKGSRETSTYVDCPQHVWHFIAVSDGVYNISFDGTANNLLGYNPHSVNDNGGIYWSSIGIMREDGSDPMNQWKIITAEEREALMAAATKDNPVDVSYLITAASMNAQDNRNAWTKEVSGGNGGPWVDNFENHGFESWNADNFKIYQKLENLPAGMYEISVQGFWREGDGANQVAIVNSGGALNQKAYLFAGDQQELLPNIASVLDFVPGVGGDATSDKGIFPNWVNEALEYMETGAYWATVKVVVGEDGELTIGVGCDEKVAFGDWTVLDNFRLTYLGNDANDVAYERALESIKDGQGYRVFTEIEGEKYYLNDQGYLVTDELKAGTFEFEKVTGGAAYEYAFLMNSGAGTHFSNPLTHSDDDACFTSQGHINTSTASRVDWDAQVFFQNADGKYAIRCTNAASGESGWASIAGVFFTANGTKAGYTRTQDFIWQIEENEDARPEALAKTADWAAKLQTAYGLVTTAAQYSSNAADPGEGKYYDNLLDNDYTTYWHSTWRSDANPDGPHYLQAELPDAAKDFYIYFAKRDANKSNGNNNNRPTQILVSGSNDGTTFTEITTISEGLPVGPAPVYYGSDKISSSEAYKYLRFTVQDTQNWNNGPTSGATSGGGYKFFTFSEFYILPSNDVTDAALPLMKGDYTDLPADAAEKVDEVAAQVNAAFVPVYLNADKFLAQIDATDTYADPEGFAANTRGTVESLVEAEYASLDDLNTAKAQVVELAKTFFSNVTPLADIDVTWFIDNPAPGKVYAPWTLSTTNGYAHANSCSEFWNQSAASIQQTISLPAGEYKLTVPAFTRHTADGDMVATLAVTGASEDVSINLVTVENTVVNDLHAADKWFYAGNGVNELEFALEEAGDVALTLTTDNTLGDHWMVFKDFALTIKAQIPAVVLNAPTLSAEEGTQGEPTVITEPLKITYTADYLEENGLNADDLKVKVTVMVMGDKPENMGNMQSETAHRVLGETFYIPLGETEFPVALKDGYVYQNIAVMSAELVKPATEGTDEEPATEEEVIATYSGAPVQLRWITVEDASPEAAYERALAAIEDGKDYRIFTEIDGEKYYVTEGGLLTNATDEGGIFTFTKVTGGTYVEYGFKIDSGSKRFTNPPLVDNHANLTSGVFATTTGNRNDWEAQVLFLSGGKYAIRSCNVPDGTSSWNDAGRTYWTFAVDDVPVPQYTYDQVYQWQLEGPLTTINVAYQLYESDGETTVGNAVTKKQEANSVVNIPASLTSVNHNGIDHPILYYDYAAEGEIGEADCTVKVIRTMKDGVVHSLADLSNEKSYIIGCDRGALLTKDGYLVSNDLSSLGDAAPADFAVIYYDETDDETDNGRYYIYSVADKMFVTNNGALAEMPNHGTDDALIMEPKADPYFFSYFSIEGTNNGLNTNGNDPYGYVINTWMNADPGNQYYMIESGEFDPTEALAALDDYFHPSYFVTYVVKDADGNTLYTSEAEPTRLGNKITELPADHKRAFMEYDEVDVTIEEAETTVEFTATWAGPFELSSSVEDATWYNMTIRSDYYVAVDEEEPYYPTTDKDLYAPESQWAFGGDPYNGILVFNRASGEGWTLTKDGNNAVMREGEYGWEIGQNSDGFTLKEPGTDYNCINQSGGSTGPLSFWNSANSPSDNGSTFRVEEASGVVVGDELQLTIDVERYPGMGYGVTVGTVDFADALAFLGVEELSTDMLSFVNPDNSEIGYAAYQNANYDGWCDADGVATNWGSTTAICVKFFQALPDGEFEICDMNGADEVGKTYTVKWKLATEEKAVVYTINVTFVEVPPVELDIVKTIEVGSVEYASSDASYIEKTLTLTDDQVTEILTALGLESLDDAVIYGWNPTTEEAVENFAGFDGWRDQNGDFANWTGNEEVPACVKFGAVMADVDNNTFLTYNINGSFSGDIKTYWAVANAENQAVLLQIIFTVTASDVQKALEEEIANAEALAEEAQNEELYDQEAIAEALATLQAAIDEAKTHLGTTDDEMAEATETLKAAEEAFQGVLTGIYGIGADQLSGTIYDLGGRKIQKVQRGGVYIVNGKKVLVK